MRHLSVPSKETARWRDILAESKWLAIGFGIHNLGKFRGIPLNDDAPSSIETFEIVELDPITTGPNHWTERLDSDLARKYSEYWPMSFDQIGDIIIIKIPEIIREFSDVIGKAILDQHPKIRSVYADNGVKGDFRVRQLSLISSHGKPSTLTKVREHGNEFLVDPTVVYYSPRLANERLKNIESAKNLSRKLGRKITVCDPYAGAGPAVVHLAKLDDIIDTIYASDLNPEAVKILRENLPNHEVACEDARNLRFKHPECCDLLLVNIPHDIMGHLPHLLYLLKKGHEVVIKGWILLKSDKVESLEHQLLGLFEGCEIKNLQINVNKSYSTTEILASIELCLIRPE